jgi:hypothetical protein
MSPTYLYGSYPYGYSYSLPLYSPGGWQCVKCGQWVSWGCSHGCPTATSVPQYTNITSVDRTSEVLVALADLQSSLDKILELLSMGEEDEADDYLDDDSELPREDVGAGVPPKFEVGDWVIPSSPRCPLDADEWIQGHYDGRWFEVAECRKGENGADYVEVKGPRPHTGQRLWSRAEYLRIYKSAKDRKAEHDECYGAGKEAERCRFEVGDWAVGGTAGCGLDPDKWYEIEEIRPCSPGPLVRLKDHDKSVMAGQLSLYYSKRERETGQAVRGLRWLSQETSDVTNAAT